MKLLLSIILSVFGLSLQAMMPALDTMKTVATSTEDNTVDVLVVFDKAGSEWLPRNGYTPQSYIDTVFNKTNTVLTNSEITEFKFRVVGIQVLDNTFVPPWHQALYAFAQRELSNLELDSSLPPFSTVRAARDACGADMVTIFSMGTEYGSVAGTGMPLRPELRDSFSEWPYTFLHMEAVLKGNTLSHELGHQFGAGHSRTQESDPGPQYSNIAAGYQDYENSSYTVMSYSYDGNGSSEGQTYFKTAIPRFSAPRTFQFPGEDIVYKVGDENNNNTAVILDNWRYIADFRSRKMTESALVEPPSFTPNGGVYKLNTTQSITIASSTPDAEIYYTTDGSLPTLNSTRYSGTIILSETTRFRAIAYKPSAGISYVVDAVFSFSNDDFIVQADTVYPFGSKLPFHAYSLVDYYGLTKAELLSPTDQVLRSWTLFSSGKLNLSTEYGYTFNYDYPSSKEICGSAKHGYRLHVYYMEDNEIRYQGFSEPFAIGGLQTITLASENLSLELGSGSHLLTVSSTGNSTPITYSSSDENVATVSSDGLLTLHGVGHSTITLSKAGDEDYLPATAQLNLVVYSNAITHQTILLSDTEFTLAPGMFDNVQWTAQTACTWNSSNSLITVSDTGLICVASDAPEGTTATLTITAQETEQYYSTSAKVTVTVAPYPELKVETSSPEGVPLSFDTLPAKSFELLRAPERHGPYQVIKDNYDGGSYTDQQSVPGKRYYYKLRMKP